MEKIREFQKNIQLCFIDYAKTFDCVDHNELWEIPKEMGIPDHLTCLLRNLYAGKEAKVRTEHRTMNWLKLEKEYIKAVYCHSACLTYMQSIWSAGLDEAQARIKFSGRNINNLRYADDINLYGREQRGTKEPLD